MIIFIIFFVSLIYSMEQNSIMMQNLLSDVHPYFGRNFGSKKSNEAVTSILKSTAFRSNTTYETFPSSQVEFFFRLALTQPLRFPIQLFLSEEQRSKIVIPMFRFSLQLWIVL